MTATDSDEVSQGLNPNRLTWAHVSLHYGNTPPAAVVLSNAFTHALRGALLMLRNRLQAPSHCHGLRQAQRDNKEGQQRRH
jgi:hypothetical protein